ncbi:MAG: hypothetical protein DMD82_15440 [Candidatus Rokuibacteriota bacterium]|nr:MAG: hypothetical protein DMD82_15440 [Candidatus Rokubacteria bacterium]
MARVVTRWIMRMSQHLARPIAGSIHQEPARASDRQSRSKMVEFRGIVTGLIRFGDLARSANPL